MFNLSLADLINPYSVLSVVIWHLVSKRSVLEVKMGGGVVVSTYMFAIFYTITIWVSLDETDERDPSRGT